MAKHMVICRGCGERFDAQPGEEGVVWVMPTRNRYFHLGCHSDWREGEKNGDNEYVDLIYDVIKRDLKSTYSWHQCEAQRLKMLENKMTNKGIYYTMLYQFVLRNNKWEPKFGFGLIPYVYKEAKEYWEAQSKNSSKIFEQYEKLTSERLVEKVVVQKKPKKRRKQIKAPE